MLIGPFLGPIKLLLPSHLRNVRNGITLPRKNEQEIHLDYNIFNDSGTDRANKLSALLDK